MRPETEAELASMIEAAQGPLRVRGGGTRAVGHSAGEVLDVGGLSGITLYDPGALTMVAQAGTPLAEVEAALTAEGQRLAFEPMDHRGLLGTSGAPTVGGMAAANVSGPRRISVGACRDFMLGVRFVDGAGQIVRNGGRVMKNVTGYDLVKLMAGSWGTLGVLTEVAFKVLPRPAAGATVLLPGLGNDAAVGAMSDALGSPFDVTGAAHLPEGPDGAPLTLIRIEGFADSVAYRAERLREMFAAHAPQVERDPGRIDALWRMVRDVEPFHGRAGDVWKISCKPSDGPAVAGRLGASGLLFDWGGGLVWALLPEGTDARDRLAGFGGHATLVRGAGRLPTFQPEPAPVAALSAGLRRRFDPRGILNPGLMA
ncbi:MAG: FAD-binding protein [Salipiger thiooxidans]|uniref:FAD-binding protein n=1 Tax=Salipiger thiooxidans TaxID=282683 RepID=UPI001CF9D626|nr:FAD-binding protein [Salipiger thiooxidans]